MRGMSSLSVSRLREDIRFLPGLCSGSADAAGGFPPLLDDLYLLGNRQRSFYRPGPCTRAYGAGPSYPSIGSFSLEILSTAVRFFARFTRAALSTCGRAKNPNG
jgi:hypothetical protein